MYLKLWHLTFCVTHCIKHCPLMPKVNLKFLIELESLSRTKWTLFETALNVIQYLPALLAPKLKRSSIQSTDITAGFVFQLLEWLNCDEKFCLSFLDHTSVHGFASKGWHKRLYQVLSSKYLILLMSSWVTVLFEVEKPLFAATATLLWILDLNTSGALHENEKHADEI